MCVMSPVFQTTLERVIAAVERDDVTRVPAAGTAREVHGDAAEVLRCAPTAHGDARHDVRHELVPPERRRRHVALHPPGEDGVAADGVAGMLDGDALHHRDERALAARVVLAALLP